MQTEQKVHRKERKNDTKLLMIVDDDLDTLTTMKKSLGSDAQIKVYSFTSPIPAVQQFTINSKDYDAVISDIRMPAMNGFELARKILQINPSTKVFLITAFEVNMKEFSMPTMFVAVESIDDYISKAQKLGAKVVKNK